MEPSVFSYNALTGEIRRKERVCGYLEKNGYIRINITHSRKVLAHRLAYFLYKGEWPNGDIDHINGDKSDNRWSNLRLATRSQNQWNRKNSTRNTSGLKGVYKDRERWRAKITKNSKVYYLGYFKSKEDAHKAYREAASNFHSGWNND